MKQYGLVNKKVYVQMEPWCRLGVWKPVSSWVLKRRKGDRLLPLTCLEVAKLPEQCFSESNIRAMVCPRVLPSIRSLSPPLGPPDISFG